MSAIKGVATALVFVLAICIYLGVQIYPIWRVCMLSARVYNGTSSTKDDPNWTWIFAVVIVMVSCTMFALTMFVHFKSRVLGTTMRYLTRASNYFFGSTITLLTISLLYEIVAGIIYGASHKKTSLYSGDGALISLIVIGVIWFVAVLGGILNTFILGVEKITITSPKIKQKVRLAHISGKKKYN